MINYTTSNTDKDLNGILDLQKANLRNILTKEEIESLGQPVRRITCSKPCIPPN